MVLLTAHCNDGQFIVHTRCYKLQQPCRGHLSNLKVTKGVLARFRHTIQTTTKAQDNNWPAEHTLQQEHTQKKP